MAEAVLTVVLENLSSFIQKQIGSALGGERDGKDVEHALKHFCWRLGRTTLAQCVFDDERVKEHFKLKMWVCVSEDFDVRRLIKAIIESGTGKVCEAMKIDPLQKRLEDMLQRKRFLIVLDDVWNEDHE
uniref:NB-ARC domain-containing protein n=1 Tax=Cannabis sativa TaxID=3483 RepID=A0A803NX27_CANSA